MKQFAPLQNTTPVVRVLIFIALLLLAIMFAGIVSLLLVKSLYDIDIANRTNLVALAQGSEQGINAIRFIQLLQQFVGMLLPALFFARLINVNVREELGFYNRTKYSTYIVAVLLVFTVVPFINFTSWINNLPNFETLFGELGRLMNKSEEESTLITTLMIDTSSFYAFATTVLIISIMPALVEEIIFRGIIQKHFAAIFRNHHAGIWCAAFIFSFIHLQFYGFIPRLLLGAAFGYIYYFSRTLWVPILAHTINNFIAILTIAYPLNINSLINPDTIGKPDTVINIAFLIASVVLSIGALYAVKKLNPKPILIVADSKPGNLPE